MSDSSASPQTSRTHIVRDFASSDLFDRTFKEGMALVEETASYLDGDGRRDSRLLNREDALVYWSQQQGLAAEPLRIEAYEDGPEDAE